MLERKKETQNLFDFCKENENSFIILTPETLTKKAYSFLFSDKNVVAVFDEFHLFYEWGGDFRPLLWECFLDVSSFGTAVLGLSATIGEKLMHVLHHELILGFEKVYIIDVGNFTLKNRPQKVHYFLEYKKSDLKERFHFEMQKKKSETFLFFCQYREQVKEYYHLYRDLGYQVLYCLGGETHHFVEKLKKYPCPDCIFSTTALSHGVNLPALSKIFFNYKVKRLDFWIQMVGRGGRKGESFEVYTFDDYFISRRVKVKSVLKNIVFKKMLLILTFFYKRRSSKGQNENKS